LNKPADLLVRGIALPSLALSSSTVWYLGTSPEVYALAALLCLCWLVVFQSRATPQQEIGRGALILGLVPGVHITAAFGGLVALSRRTLQDLKRLLTYPTQALVPVSLLNSAFAGTFALLAAASRNPEINFDNPTGLSGLWRHISAQGIQERFAAPGARPSFEESLDVHWAFISQDLGLWVLGAAVVGVILHRANHSARCLALIAVADMSYNIWVNPMGRRDLQTGILTILCLCGLAILAARTCTDILPRFKSHALVAAMIVLLLTRADSLLDDLRIREAIAHDEVPLELTRASLAPLAANSLIFTSSDDVIGLFFAARRIEGRRPDVRQVLSSFAWWPWHLEKQGLTLPQSASTPQSDDEQLAILKDILRREDPKRMVAWEPGAGVLDSVVGTWLQPNLLVSLVTQTPLDTDRWGELSHKAQQILFKRHTSIHPWSRRVVSETLRLNAVNATRRDEPAKAMRWSNEAVAADVTNGPAWNNLGVTLLKRGHASEALSALTWATKLRPHDSQSWRNLGLSLIENNKPDKAREALEKAKALAQSPRDLARATELLRQKLSP